MPSTIRVAQALFSLSLLTTTHAYNTMTYVGCFSSSTGLTENSTYEYQSSGHCQIVCVADNNEAVLGLTGGNDCWCGSETPPTADKVDDSKCNTPCTGYGQDDCGGDDFWSVYLTGTESSVGSAGGGSVSSAATSVPTASGTASSATSSAATSTTSASSSSSQQPSVVTSYSPGKTVVITESPSVAKSTSSSSASSSSTAGLTSDAHKSSGTNVAGIAAGVVVGVIVLAALIGGAMFFFMRRKRQQKSQQEYKGNSTADFTAGGKTQIPARRPLGPDARIDTEAMAQRRLSDGSIADNEDYSRRILQVTNPDDGN